MIYPQKISSKKGESIITILAIFSVILGIVLYILNRILNPFTPWSAITNAGIVYIWITVIYSIKWNTNIASHVLVQMIAISLLLFYIDNKLGFEPWSIEIGIPIVLTIANLTMFILALVTYKRYGKYVVYELFIVIFSMFPVWITNRNNVDLNAFQIVAIGTSIVSFILSFILSSKDYYRSLKSSFHM